MSISTKNKIHIDRDSLEEYTPVVMLSRDGEQLTIPVMDDYFFKSVDMGGSWCDLDDIDVTENTPVIAMRKSGKLYVIPVKDYNKLTRMWIPQNSVWEATDNGAKLVSNLQFRYITASRFSPSYYALDHNANMWVWGDNSSGQLGVPGSIYIDKPTKLNDTRWRVVSPGCGFTLAIDTDYKLWGWGENDDYQLGLGYSSPYVRTPTEITPSKYIFSSYGGPSLNNLVDLNRYDVKWVDVKASYKCSVATLSLRYKGSTSRTQEYPMCWGKNLFGLSRSSIGGDSFFDGLSTSRYEDLGLRIKTPVHFMYTYRFGTASSMPGENCVGSTLFDARPPISGKGFDAFMIPNPNERHIDGRPEWPFIVHPYNVDASHVFTNGGQYMPASFNKYIWTTPNVLVGHHFTAEDRGYTSIRLIPSPLTSVSMLFGGIVLNAGNTFNNIVYRPDYIKLVYSGSYRYTHFPQQTILTTQDSDDFHVPFWPYPKTVKGGIYSPEVVNYDDKAGCTNVSVYDDNMNAIYYNRLYRIEDNKFKKTKLSNILAHGVARNQFLAIGDRYEYV